MSHAAESSLRRQAALREIEDELLRRAETLYALALGAAREPAVSAAQMAALGERILHQTSVEAARQQVTQYLHAQFGKLELRREREGVPSSWLVAPADAGAGEDSIGALLVRWLGEDDFLTDLETPGDLDRLAALRRFWTYFHGLYRYARQTGTPMRLTDDPGACERGT